MSSSSSHSSYRQATPWADPVEIVDGPMESTPIESSPSTWSRSESGGSMLVLNHASEEGLDSPILVSPERASDYAKMSMSSATPPPSDVGIATYLSRAVKMVKKIHRMPWVVAGSERVTVDYYPGKKEEEEEEEPEELYERQTSGHVTSISWKSREYIEWRRSHYGHVASE